MVELYKSKRVLEYVVRGKIRLHIKTSLYYTMYVYVSLQV